MKPWVLEEEERQRALSGSDTAARISDRKKSVDRQAKEAQDLQQQRMSEEKEADRLAAKLKQAQLEERREHLSALSAKHAKEREQREVEMKSEQERLACELERQESLRKSQELSSPSIRLSDADDFAYNFQNGMETVLKEFRQRGAGGDTLFIQIDHTANELQIEEHARGWSLEQVAAKLDDYASHAHPCYVLHIYKKVHDHGRVSFPIAFLLFLPHSVPASLKVLYTRPVSGLCDAFSVSKYFPLDDAEDLDANWLESKFGI